MGTKNDNKAKAEAISRLSETVLDVANKIKETNQKYPELSKIWRNMVVAHLKAAFSNETLEERFFKFLDLCALRPEKKKPTKKEIAEVIKNGTPTERVNLLRITAELRNKEGGSFLTMDEQRKVLFGSKDENERDEAEILYQTFANIHKRKAAFMLYATSLGALANSVNSSLKELDVYISEAYLLNDILRSLSEENGKEKVAAAMEGGEPLPDFAQRVINNLLKHKSIDPNITIAYSPERKIFVVESPTLDNHLKDALELFRERLESAKELCLMLYSYAEKYGVLELIPDRIIDLMLEYRQEWALNLRFSSKYYKQLLQSNKPNDIIIACSMEDNGDIAFLFPHFDEIEVNLDEIENNNIFDNG